MREEGSVVILECVGDMVGGPAATQLSEKIHELIGVGKTSILVDMKNVAWMNSSGLGILIAGLTTVRNSGGDLKLLHLAKKIHELLRITKLDCVFEVFDDGGEAIASFN
jgi:anti-sigma B factor antagonist